MKNNKSNKIIKNLLFIFLVILIIICICIFNYKMDPYKIFKNKYYMKLSEYPREMIYTVMKFYKDQKSDTVIIGGSETGSLFNEKYKKFFNNINIKGIGFKEYRQLLEYYIKLHPETKKVIITISYVNIINFIDSPIPELKDTNLNIKDFQKIFFSTDSTIKSFNLLKKNILFFVFYKFNKKTSEIFNIEYYPKQSDFYYTNIDDLKILEKNNIIEINKIINLLEDKNIDYVFIIPPYNSVFMAMIYKNKDFKYFINNFKKYLAYTVPSDKKIYDFAFSNKYTSTNIYENKDALYINLSHPSYIFGIKVLKILLNDKEADNSLYFLLNRNNIETVIKKENELLENYINNNNKLIEYYQKLSKEQNNEDVFFNKRIYYKYMSKETKNEIKYLLKKIGENE